MPWDQPFEAYPGGNDFGSISCIAMRRLLSEFYTRLTKEHSITESASPIAVHIPGQSGVCSMGPGVPNTQGVIGAIALNSDVPVRLYLDDGVLTHPISGLDHSIYVLNGLAEAAHSQYLLVNAIAGFDTLTPNTLRCVRVSGLDQVEADYAADLSTIMPFGVHKGISASGGNKHPDGTIGLTNQALKPGQDKIKLEEINLYNAIMAQNGLTGELAMGSHAFFPYLDPASDNLMEVRILPAFIDVGAAFPTGAVNAKLNFVSQNNGLVKINVSRVADA